MLDYISIPSTHPRSPQTGELFYYRTLLNGLNLISNNTGKICAKEMKNVEQFIFIYVIILQRYEMIYSMLYKKLGGYGMEDTTKVDAESTMPEADSEEAVSEWIRGKSSKV